MTVAMWIMGIWVLVSVVFVGAGMWWINRPAKHPDRGELAAVSVLYPSSGREVQATPQKPPTGAA